MQAAKFFVSMRAMSIFLLALTGCCPRDSDQMWEDSKSASRHMARGFKTLCGYPVESRAVCSRDEFMPMNGAYYQPSGMNDFIPMQDQPINQNDGGDFVSFQPRETPGDPGSSIPGIEAFRDPSTSPVLAAVFRTIHFDFNSNLVKGDENLNAVKEMAAYMRRNGNTYVFVEGHCDERGPEAYNLALGSRRSNAVRNLLIQEGVNPDNIFTISFGKERPLLHESNEEAWSQNRRAEFKVYQRS